MGEIRNEADLAPTLKRWILGLPEVHTNIACSSGMIGLDNGDVAVSCDAEDQTFLKSWKQ